MIDHESTQLCSDKWSLGRDIRYYNEMGQDTYTEADHLRHLLLLEALIHKLNQRGHIRTPAVEAAFRAVPRHLFLPGVPSNDVYSDKAIITKRLEGVPISSSSQPSVMAIMLEQLDLRAGHRVLEIGTGTGCNAALMAHMVGGAGEVITMDIDDDIVETARKHLTEAGFDRVKAICGDGGLGYPPGAPFDRITLTVGAWDIAPAWREQLSPDGRLLVPLWIGGEQRTIAFEPAKDHLQSVSASYCGFMRMRGRWAGPEAIIPLGPDGAVTLAVDDPEQVDADAIYRLLMGSGQNIPTGIWVDEREAWEGLGLWLALHESGFFNLMAEGEAASSAPCLHGVAGKICASSGLLQEETMCILIRPPGGKPAPQMPVEEPVPFELFVRLSGPDEELARRLIDQVAAWDAGGRPTTERLSIKAFPSDAAFSPSTGDVVLPKRWTNLVCSFPAAG